MRPSLHPKSEHVLSIGSVFGTSLYLLVPSRFRTRT